MAQKQPYTVGYKKPPTQTRFKKGQSGNPSGRRRLKSGTIRDTIAQMLEATWDHESGSTYRDHVVAGLLKKAMLGQTSCLALILREFE
jgi:hypothetical protein